MIIDEATNLDYDVLQSNITIFSLPKFSFKILTDGSEFKYGNRSMSDSHAELLRVMLNAGICIATVSGVFAAIYYRKDSYE